MQIGFSDGAVIIAKRVRLKYQEPVSLKELDSHVSDRKEGAPLELQQVWRVCLYADLMKRGARLPPVPLEFFGVKDPVVLDFAMPRLTGQPPETFFEPVSAKPFPPAMRVGFAYCSGYGTTFVTPSYEKAWLDPRIRTDEIESDHLCMLSNPRGTSKVLLNLA